MPRRSKRQSHTRLPPAAPPQHLHRPRLRPFLLGLRSRALPLLLALAHIAIVTGVKYRAGWHQNPTSSTPLKPLYGAASILLLFECLRVLYSRRPWLHAAVRTAVTLAYAVLLLYRLHQGFPLRFGLIFNNFSEAFSPASLHMIAHAFPAWLLPSVGVATLAALAADVYQTGTQPATPAPRQQLALFVLLYLGWALSKPKADMLTNFVASFGAYQTKDAAAKALVDADQTSNTYPYMKVVGPKPPLDTPAAGLPDAPHVFIILLESFNAHFVEARTPDGREYTPFFNELLERGTYFETFYGNAIQTARGQLTSLCGILDGYKGKVFTAYPQLRLRCLPQILREQGYQTLFFKAFSDLKFDKTETFGIRHGFDVVRGMQEAFSDPAMAKYIWGWGLQDNYFYRAFFRYLDERQEAAGRAQPPAAPHFFATLHTVTNHYNFSEVPPDQRYLFPQPQAAQEYYANSLYLSDLYLREFFDQLALRPYLKNSLVILLGDHSFPAGEHGGFSNEWGAYEESFRTPMLILWPGHVPPARNKTPASQLDLAPTVLDLLHIETPNHFVGAPLLASGDAKPAADRIIPMIQPYNGSFLVEVEYPYKYVYQIDSNAEYFFNLATDPGEMVNIAPANAANPIFLRLKKAVEDIHRNQRLIEENRVWPYEGGKPE